ncbi:nucleoplasmin-like protein ANO39 [Leptopilina boulardi]|uniref:nucleoplasmin-like protein ANO39 n=1 Tax=Leptopilina boulardi TaxID=63433 RepID=UPI0021F53613|nr:nucleoplasmin-like protein ANO39 [Leptopilina boulardi]
MSPADVDVGDFVVAGPSTSSSSMEKDKVDRDDKECDDDGDSDDNDDDNVEYEGNEENEEIEANDDGDGNYRHDDDNIDEPDEDDDDDDDDEEEGEEDHQDKENIAPNKSRIQWKKKMTSALIEIVSTLNEKTSLKGVKFWNKVKDSLKEKGYDKAPAEKCKSKWGGLLKGYDRNLKKLKRSGASPVRWTHFEEMHTMMFKKPTISPPAIASSIKGYEKRIREETSESASTTNELGDDSKKKKINPKKNIRQTELMQQMLDNSERRSNVTTQLTTEVLGTLKDMVQVLKDFKK